MAENDVEIDVEVALQSVADRETRRLFDESNLLTLQCEQMRQEAVNAIGEINWWRFHYNDVNFFIDEAYTQWEKEDPVAAIEPRLVLAPFIPPKAGWRRNYGTPIQPSKIIHLSVTDFYLGYHADLPLSRRKALRLAAHLIAAAKHSRGHWEPET